MEQQHVHEVYRNIAGHFSSTRYKPWPLVERFLAELAPGSFVLDVGCGNGKYLGCNPRVVSMGVERCPEFCDICMERGHPDMATGDGLAVPVRSGVCDAVISIAVVHHHASLERRRAAVAEMARCLRVGGQMLIYVWAVEQTKRKFDSQDVFVPWTLQNAFNASAAPKPALSLEEKRARGQAKKAAKKAAKQAAKLGGQQQGAGEEPKTAPVRRSPKKLAPAQLSQPEGPSKPEGSPAEGAPGEETVFKRYYHMFTQRELEELVGSVECLEQLKCYFDHENWCIVAQKKN